MGRSMVDSSRAPTIYIYICIHVKIHVIRSTFGCIPGFGVIDSGRMTDCHVGSSIIQQAQHKHVIQQSGWHEHARHKNKKQLSTSYIYIYNGKRKWDTGVKQECPMRCAGYS